MRSYTIFGAGFLSGAVLISSVFLIGDKAGKVVYTSPDTNTASVLVTEEKTEISEIPTNETLNDNTKEVSLEPQEEPSPTAAEPEAESSSAQTTFSSDYITELQEQVETLIEQVNAQTEEPTVEKSESDEVFFTTPTGVKLDAEGNVIDESSSQSGDAVQSVQTQQTEPGVFITPTGVKIDAEGNVIE